MTHTCWISFAIAIILLVCYLESVASNSLFADKTQIGFRTRLPSSVSKNSQEAVILCKYVINYILLFCKSTSEDVKNA